MTTNHTDLIARLRALSRYEHDDATIGDEAADALEAMQADAARYRWLRGGADIPPESNRWARWEVRQWDGRWWNTLFAEQLDAAIERAVRRQA